MGNVFVAVVLFGISAFGCGSGYTIVDRSSLEVSPNSRISAKNLVPQAAAFPVVVEQLGLAQEVYQKQLFLLKERRNKLRARRRYLNASSFGTFAATSMGVGLAAIQSSDSDAPDRLEKAGYAALGGLALGTLLQVAGYMQEDSSSVDSKVRHLELLYDTMIERLRQLSSRMTASEGTRADDVSSDMGVAIEGFITQALAINVKG